jgi:hypothetical protein
VAHQEDLSAIATVRSSFPSDKKISILEPGRPGCLALCFGSRRCLAEALDDQGKYQIKSF